MSRRSYRPVPFALALLFLLSAAAAPAAAGVKVVRKPAVVKYHAFDPQDRPTDMPPLKRGEAALCVSEFGAAAELRYTQSTRRQAAGKHQSRVTVDDVRLELTLKVDVWLPHGASDKLKAHEEGHRRIAERVYDEVAERAARAAAQKLVDAGRVEAEGESTKAAQDAVSAALAKAQDAMIRAYLDQTSQAGQKVQEAYDEITAHGRRAEVTEDDAIRQAWEQHTPPMWAPPGAAGATTRPGPRPATRPARR